MPERNPQAKRILFVGRLSPDEGVHILVDAFEKIIRKFPQAELKIVGPWQMLRKSFCIAHSREPMVRDLLAFYDRERYVDQLRQRMTPEARARVDITKAISRERKRAVASARESLTVVYAAGNPESDIFGPAAHAIPPLTGELELM
jgi:glycosyltransferase involved in cell wall biosynthesis